MKAPQIQVRDLVRFKGREMTTAPGRRIRGSECRVIAVFDDAVGTVYRVEDVRTGRIHTARREHLERHRNQLPTAARRRA